MGFRAIRSWIGAEHAGKRCKVAGALPQRDFAQVLRRERDRADRTEDVVTLVTLDLRESHRGNSAFGQTLARILAGRLRSTDDAGWLEDSRLGLVLPHTPEEGAWSLVHALRTTLERDSGRFELPGFAVYAYSGRDGRDGDDGGFPGDGSGNGKEPDGLPQWSANGSLQVRSLALEPLLLEPISPGKRAIDILLASTGLILFAPLIAVSAVAIKCTSRGPAFFRHLRAGYGGRPFPFYKLRTMVEGADEIKAELEEHNEADGPVFKISKDPRVTPVGRVLRKLSIDELPQLWNVLRGDMSIVGPRPPTLEEIEHYEPWQRRRLHAKGGLTCIWQVSGRSDIGFLEWMRLDLRYLRERSLTKDLVLILKTIPAVLIGRGAK